jgi:hypothetical protein
MEKANAMQAYKRDQEQANRILMAATDDGARLKAMFVRIKADGQALSELIEAAALSCVIRAILHGDVNSATILVTDTLHAGVDRSRAVANWLQLHGPMTWEAKSNGFKLNKTVRDAKLALYNQDPEAFKSRLINVESAFYVLTKPSKPVSFNLFGKLQAIIKQAHAIQNGERNVDGKVDIRGLDVADNFLRNMERALRIGDTDASARKAKADDDTLYAIDDQSDLIKGEAIEIDGDGENKAA